MHAASHLYQMAYECLSDELPRRWAHVEGVTHKASAVAHLLGDSDAHILVAAALMHDIGYSAKISKTGFHPLDGAEYLEAKGESGRLCALVAHHSCARMEAELRGLSKSLEKWVDEEGPVRDALWWADMTTTPDGKPTNLQMRIVEIQERYGLESLVSKFIARARVELAAAVERTEERLRAAGLGHLAK